MRVKGTGVWKDCGQKAVCVIAAAKTTTPQENSVEQLEDSGLIGNGNRQGRTHS